mmetsp:Transcript_26310/g.46421  ORF Transcript_26310/g.46421 Transcript_26310/m.46421 type:complete len:344 (+) Transcript_26310:100-1131(+)
MTVKMSSFRMDQTSSIGGDGIWIVAGDGEGVLKGITLIADRKNGDIVGLSARSCNDEDKRKEMPSLKEHTTLKVIDLHNYRYMIALNDSIGSVPALERLVLSRCDSLRTLSPAIGKLHNLIELDLSDSYQVYELPEEISGLTSLKRLKLGCSSGVANKVLMRLPESLGKLTSLEEICLDNCKALKTLPPSIGELKNLARLHLRECKSLKFLPPSIVKCCNLVELSLLKCISLKSLPSDIGDLTLLEDLICMKCKSLKEIPPSIGKCEYLSVLDLRSCTGLVTLPDELGSLTRLRCLQLDNCTNLVEIPELVGELPTLESIGFSNCPLLESIPFSCSKFMDKGN